MTERKLWECIWHGQGTLIQTLNKDIAYNWIFEHQKKSSPQLLLLSQLQTQDRNILISQVHKGPSYAYYLNLQASNHWWLWWSYLRIKDILLRLEARFFLQLPITCSFLCTCDHCSSTPYNWIILRRDRQGFLFDMAVYYAANYEENCTHF